MDNTHSELVALRSRVARYDELWAEALPRLRSLDELQSRAHQRGFAPQAVHVGHTARSSDHVPAAQPVVSLPDDGRSVLEPEMSQSLADRNAMRNELDTLYVERQAAVAEIGAVLSDLDTIRRDVRHLVAERARLAREVNALHQQKAAMSAAIGPNATPAPAAAPAGRAARRVPTPNRVPSPSPSVDIDLPAAEMLATEGDMGTSSEEEERAFAAFFDAVDDKSEKERRWMLG